MKRFEAINLMNNNPVFYLATIDETIPRVRGMLLYRANENELIFHTGSMKKVYKELSKNPNVELCFNSRDGIQLRLDGKVVEVNDIDLKNEILNHPSRGFAREWIDEGITNLDELIVYKIKYNTARIWTMDKNFEPNEIIDLN